MKPYGAGEMVGCTWPHCQCPPVKDSSCRAVVVPDIKTGSGATLHIGNLDGDWTNARDVTPIWNTDNSPPRDANAFFIKGTVYIVGARPSRGWRRHVRRVKELKRRAGR